MCEDDRVKVEEGRCSVSRPLLPALALLLAPVAAHAGELLVARDLPLVLGDGRTARVSILRVPAEADRSEPRPEGLQALDSLLAGIDPACVLSGQVVGSAEAGVEGDAGALGVHRLARERAEAVRDHLAARGLPAGRIAAVWDFTLAFRERGALVWLFRLDDDECAGGLPADAQLAAASAGEDPGATPPAAVASGSPVRPEGTRRETAVPGSAARGSVAGRPAPGPDSPVAEPEPARSQAAVPPAGAAASGGDGGQDPDGDPAPRQAAAQGAPAGSGSAGAQPPAGGGGVEPPGQHAMAPSPDTGLRFDRVDAPRPGTGSAGVAVSAPRDHVVASHPVESAAAGRRAGPQPDGTGAASGRGHGRGAADAAGSGPVSEGVAGTDLPTLRLVFDVNSSFLGPDNVELLRAWLASLPAGRWRAELVAAVGPAEAVKADSRAQAEAYERWLAERRAGRVQGQLERRLGPALAELEVRFVHDDPSRSVEIRLWPADGPERAGAAERTPRG